MTTPPVTRAVAAFACACGLVFGAHVLSARATAAGRPSVDHQVERGKYLVIVAGCNDCHTTKKMGPHGPEPDMSRMLAGHPAQMRVAPPARPDSTWSVTATPTLTAWSGPWGVSFATNLTPDRNTGLGIWTAPMFVAAMRSGKHMGTSRPILPPMPWEDFAHMSDAI